MRKQTILTLLIFSLLSFNSFASVGGLIKNLSAQSGDEKIETYQKIITHYLQEQKGDSARHYFAEAAKSFDTNHPFLMISDGQIKTFDNDAEAAIKVLFKALESAQEKGNSEAIATAKLQLGNAYFKEKSMEEAEQYLKAAMVEFQSLDNPVGMGDANHTLGKLFLSKNIIGTAQEYLSQAIQLKASSGDLLTAANIASQLGITLREGNYFESSAVYQNTALQMFQSLNNTAAVADQYSELTKTSLAQSYFDEAMSYNDQSNALFTKTGDLAGIAESNLHFAQIYFGNNNSAKAKEYLAKAKASILALPSSAKKVYLLKGLSDVYASNKDFQNSYESQNQYLTARADWESVEKSNALSEVSKKYESKFKAKEQLQQIELLEAQKAAESKNKWLWALLSLLAIAAASMLYFSLNLKKRDNKLLSEKNQQIEEARAELQEKNTSLDALNGRLLEEISEREYLEKSSFERDRFLATMTHRMGTPLNSIVGLSHLLMDENLQPQQRETLRTLQFAANSLVVFINDVLDYSKIEAGKLKPQETAFQPRRLFNDLRDQAQMEAEEKGLNLQFSYNNKIPKTVKGDPARMNQILTNLLSTSLRSTMEGNIDVKFDLAEETEEHLMFYFEISDTGKALDPDVIRRVFQAPDEYYLLGKQNGIAFAMTMARRLTELQGGKFELFVNENHGNLFRFWLPFKKVDEARANAIENKSVAQRIAGHKILLVEDNQINQMVVAKMMRNIGVTIVTANNGLEAVEAVKEQNFDLILMDIQMPEMDGYRATAAIRKMADPVKKIIPIIALTASAFLTHEDKARLFGMDEYVGKPFSPDELMEKIDKLLRVRVRKS